MKTKKNLANMMFMSIVAAATVSFTACSDDVIDEQKNDNVITASQNSPLLEPAGLVYTDFITENDVTILTPDTTEISVSKAYADKMGIDNFVNRPMGIWDKKEHASYLRKATEQRLIGDRYILKVTRSSLAEVIGGRNLTLNTSLYYNPGAATTRAASTGMPEEAAKYIDENNIIHPAAITINSMPGEDAMTRGAVADYGTWTVEEIFNGEMDADTRWWNPFKAIKEKVIDKVVDKVVEGYNYVKEKTAYTIDSDKNTYSILRHKSELKKEMKFECGPAESDTINVNFKCPIQFDVDYTLEVHAKGDVSSAWIPRLNYLETYFDGYFAVNPELKVGFSKDISLPKDKQRINLCKLGGIGVTFMIGVVPVHIDFDPSIYLKLTAALEGSAYVGLNYDFAAKFRAGVKYDNGWNGIGNGEIVKNEFSLIKPTVELEAKAGVGLMFGVDVIIDKIAGPTLAMGPQVNAKATISYTRWMDAGKWDFKAQATAGCAGEFGAKIKVLGYELADWKRPFELGPQKTIFEYPKAN
jgi:hypothetical protein